MAAHARTRESISERALSNLNPPDPQTSKLHAIRSHCFHNQYDPTSNPDGIVALAIAENKLMRQEIVDHVNSNMNITPWHLTYGHGPAGSIDLRRAIAEFVTEVFKPSMAIGESHVAVCNGAGSAVDNLSFCLGEPGDARQEAYTVPEKRVKPVLVSFGDINPTSAEAVSSYEAGLLESNAAGVKIRAILLASPHNPFGRPYDNDFLVGIMRLCAKYNIHLISDEVYAKSHFPSNDVPVPPPFVSVLSFDLQKYIDPTLVHVIYAMSKDFCANGVRIGAVISPSNGRVLKAFRAVASFTRASQLAEHAWLNLLNDKPFQQWYFPLLQHRMTESYEFTTSYLRKHNIPYSKASVTSFIWLDLSGYLREDSVEAEIELNWKMAHGGVWVAMGASFASERNGNFRITFATPREELSMGLDRLTKVLREVEKEMGLAKMQER
ncbi:putative aspartate aminotransferase [Cladophialophora carrionii]|uniref:Putative aspartate aminotransferase n=1 Tax=Cladophialophora carrionii TaxID=86049 RepID=A0A1C1CZG2_9EURO|nr:putative aspartate aminotransferase [Cladophialophora carrionii]